MNAKLVLLLQVVLLVDASSRSRYSHRTHEAVKQPDSFDCMFNICESDPHYPEEAVKRIVNQHRSFHSFLTGRVIEPIQGVSISTRSHKESKPFCKMVDVQVTPKTMTDVENVKRRIVNVRNHSQILKFQKCNLEGGDQCYEERILDIKTKCVQMYSNIKLVTADVTNEVLEYHIFRIPTTCVCTYIKKFT
ncbi:hypothetical protein Zmor_022421 [Zophobas morio]|uniref:Spaetzle domain-containing protein n=1 Tax=Zophobas morio TaxID=2755281 RepID=A0AA38HXP8_9CUCU|nr:hypothetical protein Zmor_022421 [Zophobas morio]